MRAPTGELSFDYDGTEYIMIFDMMAIAFFERQAGVSLFEAMLKMEEAQNAGAMPMVSHLAFLMQAGLRKRHPELTLDDIMPLISRPEVLEALGVGFRSAMPSVDQSAEGKAPAQSKERKGSTGTRPSKGRSKPG